MVKVQTMKGVANRIDPESCIVAREGGGEALTGERAGQAIEPRKMGRLGCRRRPAHAEGNITDAAIARQRWTPRGLRTLSMHGNTLRGNGEIPGLSVGDGLRNVSGSPQDASR